ncbi:MAG: adenosylcobinamide-GDP ribazoletransferase [Sterolibacteriaceae bacterium MAG5]|nr:adenosylcobinamide-GDP ribazoletransferase [Candidatus Nitricoxidireducens bremensis]
MLRNELVYFFAALRFFTRLPVPAWIGHADDHLVRAPRYLPLVGILVGLIGGAATLAASLLLPLSLAVTIGMAATILATGAFHEDGFADACDGFGGGWDKARVLAIMKDSRVGSYGVIGVVLLLLAKWNALMEMEPEFLLPALVAGHAASRFAAVSLMGFLDYAREDDGAKSKPLASRLGGGSLALAALFGIVPCVLLPLPEAAAALAAAALVAMVAARYFARRIGGYTGDCLGAVQQAAELAFYLGLLCDFS